MHPHKVSAAQRSDSNVAKQSGRGLSMWKSAHQARTSTRAAAFGLAATLYLSTSAIAANELYVCCGARESCDYGAGTRNGCIITAPNSCSLLKIDRQKRQIAIDGDNQDTARWTDSRVILSESQGRIAKSIRWLDLNSMTLRLEVESTVCTGGCYSGIIRSAQSCQRTPSRFTQ